MVNAGTVKGESSVFRRRIFANLLPIQVEFCVCRIPLNIRASSGLTNRGRLLAGIPVSYVHINQ
jgi:hypothetical protein